MKKYEIRFDYLKKFVAITHGKINISGGNIFQHEIYKAIKKSGKHEEVYEEYPIPLVGNGKRKHHKVDILIVDEDIVIATNSKGKSFNNTDSEDAKLSDTKLFIKSIQKKFPNHKVVYQYFKDEYGTKKIPLYEYFEKNGIPVYNTEDYLIEHYGIDFDALEERRQKECVKRWEEAIKDIVDIEAFYAAAK